MQTANVNLPRQPLRFRTVAVRVLVLAAILTCFRVQEYRHMQDAWNAHQAESLRLGAIDDATAQQIGSFGAGIRATQHRRATLTDLAQKFNGGHDFPNSGNNHLYVDPISGGRALISVFPGDHTLAMVLPDYNRPGPAAVPEPSIAALVVAFFASIAGCVVLLIRYIRALQTWAQQSRHQRIKSGRNLAAVGITAVYFGWLGSKFFPGWKPFGDAQILGYQIIFASLSLLFILSAYFTRKPDDSTPRCQHCRYDLTGNVSGICPECGTVTSLGKAD